MRELNKFYDSSSKQHRLELKKCEKKWTERGTIRAIYNEKLFTAIFKSVNN